MHFQYFHFSEWVKNCEYKSCFAHTKNYVNLPGHMTNMAVMPACDKNF